MLTNDYASRYQAAALSLADRSSVSYDDLVSTAVTDSSLESFTFASREDIGREARRIRRERGQGPNQ